MLKKKKLMVLLLVVVMMISSITVMSAGTNASDYAYCYLGEARMMGECRYGTGSGWGTTYFYLNNVSVPSEVTVKVTIHYEYRDSDGTVMETFYNDVSASSDYDVEARCYPNITGDTEVIGVFADHTGSYGGISDDLYTESGIIGY